VVAFSFFFHARTQALDQLTVAFDAVVADKRDELARAAHQATQHGTAMAALRNESANAVQEAIAAERAEFRNRLGRIEAEHAGRAREQARVNAEQAEAIASLRGEMRQQAATMQQLQGRWRFLADAFACKFVREELVKKIVATNPDASYVWSANDTVLKKFGRDFPKESKLYFFLKEHALKNPELWTVFMDSQRDVLGEADPQLWDTFAHLCRHGLEKSKK
jgi:hypothetical protein